MKTIFFDFDGIIIKSEVDKFKFIKKELKKKGFTLKSEKINDFVGKKSRFFLKQEFKKLSDKDIEDIIKKRDIWQNKHNFNLVKNIDYLLKNLKEYKIVLVTGSSRGFVTKILRDKNLIKYFDLLVTGEEFKESKPNPECYLVAMKKAKVTFKDCIIVEDSEAGVLAANKASCRVFLLEKKYNKLIKGNYIRFKNHSQLKKLIK